MKSKLGRPKQRRSENNQNCKRCKRPSLLSLDRISQRIAVVAEVARDFGVNTGVQAKVSLATSATPNCGSN